MSEPYASQAVLEQHGCTVASVTAMIYERILVERAKGGDRRAAEHVVRRYYPAVYRFLRHLTWGHEDAQDLAQTTFLRASQGIEGFRFQCSFGHWLHKIAYREYQRWLRDRRETAPLDEAGSVPSPDSCGTALIALFGALDRLDDDLRTTFLLHEVEGASVRETADITGVPEGTVKSRLSRARALLQRHLSSTEPATVRPKWEERHESS